MNVKLGVSTWVWVSPLTTELLEELVPPSIAAFGFDHVEIPPEQPGDIDYVRARDLVQEHGLGISIVAVMAADRDLLHENPALRENAASYVRHCIDAAETMGARRIVGPFYSAVGRLWISPPEQRQREEASLVPSLRGLADYAARKDVVLCLEPVNRFETSFINTAAQAVRLVDRVDHPNFQMALDTFHMNLEEKSLGEAIRNTGPRLAHFHVGENDRGTVGSGHVPWVEVAAALRDIRYDGAVVMETFSSKVESIAAAAAIWRPLAEDQDTLAQEGLAFLRQLLEA
jgi:D-psicose/D-tagatose/L-ribulose 3-epimerase